MTARADVIRSIQALGVIPVVRADTPEDALQIVAAIKAGGLTIVEMTLTVPDAVDLIKELAADRTLIVGAGSVLDAATADACIGAGARFVVSPALDAETIKHCRAQGVVAMPGALTPNEIVRAWSAGADFVKVFPAGALGGPAYIRSLKGPLPKIQLVPTGGVTLANAAGFIEAGAAAIGVGTELTRGDVTAATRAFLEAVRGARAGTAAAHPRSK